MRGNVNSDVTCNAASNAEGTTMPKHIPFPEFPGNSELLNELIMFLFTSCVTAMQFINIYRTNWWLAQSNISNAVNLYYIEPYLIVLIVVMNARRLLYCLLLRGMEFLLSPWLSGRRHMVRYAFGGVLAAHLVLCITKVYIHHNYLTIFLLVYPFIVYLLIFGFQCEPFLRTSCEVEGAYFNGMPLRCCSVSPNAIRDEIEVLRNDFNNRFKQVIFTSVVNAYYAGFVPCFFASSTHYNVVWATQHIALVWLSVLTLCIAFNFPSRYSDILHRASLHLGNWTRLELRPGADYVVSASAAVWNKNILWPNNSIIKHSGDLYRCSGPITVAVPGSSSHMRFHKLFHNPSLIYMVLTAVQMSIVLVGILLLYYAIEWHFVLSISFITLTNQFTLFKVMRDYLITKRVYFAEISISDKQLSDN